MPNKERKIGAAIGLAIGFLAGSGTGIVGGLFGGIPGFWLFLVLGGILGWYMAPDILRFTKSIFGGRR